MLVMYMDQPNTTPVGNVASRFHDALGFTLIELMVTIAVASILLAVGIPSFNTFVSSQRLRTATYDLSSMLLLARSEAIKRNGEVAVKSETAGWASGFTVQASDVVLKRQSAFGDISISNTATTVTYTNTGRLKNGVTSFQIEKGLDKRCVRVDPSGMPASKMGVCA
jgi:type IV fimbrial biogenesis protein FimT